MKITEHPKQNEPDANSDQDGSSVPDANIMFDGNVAFGNSKEFLHSLHNAVNYQLSRLKFIQNSSNLLLYDPIQDLGFPQFSQDPPVLIESSHAMRTNYSQSISKGKIVYENAIIEKEINHKGDIKLNDIENEIEKDKKKDKENAHASESMLYASIPIMDHYRMEELSARKFISQWVEILVGSSKEKNGKIAPTNERNKIKIQASHKLQHLLNEEKKLLEVRRKFLNGNDFPMDNQVSFQEPKRNKCDWDILLDEIKWRCRISDILCQQNLLDQQRMVQECVQFQNLSTVSISNDEHFSDDNFNELLASLQEFQNFKGYPSVKDSNKNILEWLLQLKENNLNGIITFENICIDSVEGIANHFKNATYGSKKHIIVVPKESSFLFWRAILRRNTINFVQWMQFENPDRILDLFSLGSVHLIPAPIFKKQWHHLEFNDVQTLIVEEFCVEIPDTLLFRDKLLIIALISNMKLEHETQDNFQYNLKFLELLAKHNRKLCSLLKESYTSNLSNDQQKILSVNIRDIISSNNLPILKISQIFDYSVKEVKHECILSKEQRWQYNIARKLENIPLNISLQLICNHPSLVQVIPELHLPTSLEETKYNKNSSHISGKFEMLWNILQDFQRKSEKVIIITHFLETIPLLEDFLDDFLLDNIVIHSGLSLMEKISTLNIFQNTKFSILISTIEQSLYIEDECHLIYFDFIPAFENQSAEAVTSCLHMNNAKIIHYIVCQDTIEEDVFKSSNNLSLYSLLLKENGESKLKLDTTHGSIQQLSPLPEYSKCISIPLNDEIVDIFEATITTPEIFPDGFFEEGTILTTKLKDTLNSEYSAPVLDEKPVVSLKLDKNTLQRVRKRKHSEMKQESNVPFVSRQGENIHDHATVKAKKQRRTSRTQSSEHIESNNEMINIASESEAIFGKKVIAQGHPQASTPRRMRINTSGPQKSTEIEWNVLEDSALESSVKLAKQLQHTNDDKRINWDFVAFTVNSVFKQTATPRSASSCHNRYSSMNHRNEILALQSISHQKSLIELDKLMELNKKFSSTPPAPTILNSKNSKKKEARTYKYKSPMEHIKSLEPLISNRRKEYSSLYYTNTSSQSTSK